MEGYLEQLNTGPGLGGQPESFDAIADLSHVESTSTLPEFPERGLPVTINKGAPSKSPTMRDIMRKLPHSRQSMQEDGTTKESSKEGDSSNCARTKGKPQDEEATGGETPLFLYCLMAIAIVLLLLVGQTIGGAAAAAGAAGFDDVHSPCHGVEKDPLPAAASSAAVMLSPLLDLVLIAAFGTSVRHLGICSHDGHCDLASIDGLAILTCLGSVVAMLQMRGSSWVLAALGFPSSAKIRGEEYSEYSRSDLEVVQAPDVLTCTEPLRPAGPPPMLVTGISMGLPAGPASHGAEVDPFDPDHAKQLWKGKRFVRSLNNEELSSCKSLSEGCRTRLAGMLPALDASQYGMGPKMLETMDTTSIYGVAAGVVACRQAGLLDPLSEAPKLRAELQEGTGVIYASSFPTAQPILRESNRQAKEGEDFEYNRKTLISWLNPASSQLAALIGAKGPVTATNNTCAGTTYALAMAQDWLRAGRCERVVVVSSDDATSPATLPWLANGFDKLGVLSCKDSADSWAPFAKNSDGFILSAGALAMVIEPAQPSVPRPCCAARGELPILCELLTVEIANHGRPTLSLDQPTTNKVFQKAMDSLPERVAASDLVYFAHETGTKVCGTTELTSLRSYYGQHASQVLISSTKGLLGHSMGNCFEDVVSVMALRDSCVPPCVGLEEQACQDEFSDMQFAGYAGAGTSLGSRRYVAHYAAGFGGHYALAVYKLHASS